jgi:HK97 family phage portal protein
MNLLQRIFGIEERKAMPTNGGINENSYVLSQAQSFFSSLMLNNTGQTVNADTAEKLSAFYACLRNISEDISKVPFYVVQFDAQGNKTRVKNRATSLLNKMPSGLSTPFTFRQTLIKNALIFGNGYAYIQRDNDAKPINLYIIDPRYVTVQIVDQKLYYIVNDVKSGIIGTFTEDNIFHVRGMGDGYVGKSIIVYGAESIGAALAVQTYAGSFFGSGATMGGYIKVPNAIQDENVGKAIQSSFTNSYKTPNGANNGIAILHSGAEFQKFTAQPNESQMVETREFTVAEIARWYRMPLSKLQAGSTGSSNLEQLNIEYVTDCLMPWFVKIEQEVERKLFTFAEMDLLDAKFDVSQLMRGDMASTSNYLKTLFYAGMINRNDARRFIDYNTISEEFGETYYSPVNMIPANKEDEFWNNKDNSQASQSQVGQGGEPQ